MSDPLAIEQANQQAGNIADPSATYNPEQMSDRSTSAINDAATPQISQFVQRAPLQGTINNAFENLMTEERRARINDAYKSVNPALLNKIEIINAKSSEEVNRIISNPQIIPDSDWQKKLGVDATYNRTPYQVLKINGELIKTTDLQSSAELQNLANKQGQIILDPNTANDAQKLQNAKEASNFYNLLLSKENESNTKAFERYDLGVNSASDQELAKAKKVDNEGKAYDIQSSLGLFTDDNESNNIKQYAIAKGDKEFVIDYKSKLIDDKSRQANLDGRQDDFKRDLLNPNLRTNLSSNWKTANDWSNDFFLSPRDTIAVPSNLLQTSATGVNGGQEYAANVAKSKALYSSMGDNVKENLDALGSLFSGKASAQDAYKTIFDNGIETIGQIYGGRDIGTPAKFTSINRDVVKAYVSNASDNNIQNQILNTSFNKAGTVAQSVGLGLRAGATALLATMNLGSQVANNLPSAATFRQMQGQPAFTGIQANITSQDVSDYILDNNIEPILASNAKDGKNFDPLTKEVQAGVGYVLNAASGENKKENLTKEELASRGLMGTASFITDIYALGGAGRAGAVVQGIGSRMISSLVPATIRANLANATRAFVPPLVGKIATVIGKETIQAATTAPFFITGSSALQGDSTTSAADKYLQSIQQNTFNLAVGGSLSAGAKAAMGRFISSNGAKLLLQQEAKLAATNQLALSSPLQSSLLQEALKIGDDIAFQKAQNTAVFFDTLTKKGINIAGQNIKLGNKTIQTAGFFGDQLVQTGGFALAKTYSKLEQLQKSKDSKGFGANLQEAAFGEGGAFTVSELVKDFSTNIAFGLGTKSYKGQNPQAYKQQLYDAVKNQPLVAKTEIIIDSIRPGETVRKMVSAIEGSLPESNYVKNAEGFVMPGYENGEIVNDNAKFKSKREVAFGVYQELVDRNVNFANVEKIVLGVHRPSYKDGVDAASHNYQTASLLGRIGAIENQANVFNFDVIYKDAVPTASINGVQNTFAKSQNLMLTVKTGNGSYVVQAFDKLMEGSEQDHVDAISKNMAIFNEKLQNTFGEEGSDFRKVYEGDKSGDDVSKSRFGVSNSKDTDALVYEVETTTKEKGQKSAKTKQWVDVFGTSLEGGATRINKKQWIVKQFEKDLVTIYATANSGRQYPEYIKMIQSDAYEGLKNIVDQVNAVNAIIPIPTEAVGELSLRNKIIAEVADRIIGSEEKVAKYLEISKNTELTEKQKSNQYTAARISKTTVDLIKTQTELQISNNPEIAYTAKKENKEIVEKLKAIEPGNAIIPNKENGYLTAIEEIQKQNNDALDKFDKKGTVIKQDLLDKQKAIEELLDDTKFQENNQAIKDALNTDTKSKQEDTEQKTTEPEVATDVADEVKDGSAEIIKDRPVKLSKDKKTIADAKIDLQTKLANIQNKLAQAKQKKIDLIKNRKAQKLKNQETIKEKELAKKQTTENLKNKIISSVLNEKTKIEEDTKSVAAKQEAETNKPLVVVKSDVAVKKEGKSNTKIAVEKPAEIINPESLIKGDDTDFETIIKDKKPELIKQFNPEYLKQLTDKDVYGIDINKYNEEELGELLEYNDNYDDNETKITKIDKDADDRIIADKKAVNTDETEINFDESLNGNKIDDEANFKKQLAEDPKVVETTVENLGNFYNRILPKGIETVITKEYITTRDGSLAVGQFSRSLNQITLVSKDGRVKLDVAGHEAYHSIFDTLPEARQSELLDVMRENLIKSGKVKEADLQSYLEKQHSYDPNKISLDKLLEEEMADRFGEYFTKTKIQKPITGLLPKLKKFFVDLYQNLQAWTGTGDKIEQLYKQIVDGKFVDARYEKGSKEDIANKKFIKQIKMSNIIGDLYNVIEDNKTAKIARNEGNLELQQQSYAEKTARLNTVINGLSDFGYKSTVGLDTYLGKKIAALFIETPRGVIAFHLPKQIKINRESSKAIFETKDLDGSNVTTVLKYDPAYNMLERNKELLRQTNLQRIEGQNLNETQILQQLSNLSAEQARYKDKFGNLNEAKMQLLNRDLMQGLIEPIVNSTKIGFDQDISYKVAGFKSKYGQAQQDANKVGRGLIATHFKNSNKANLSVADVNQLRYDYVTNIIKPQGKVVSTADDGKIELTTGGSREFTQAEWQTINTAAQSLPPFVSKYGVINNNNKLANQKSFNQSRELISPTKIGQFVRDNIDSVNDSLNNLFSKNNIVSVDGAGNKSTVNVIAHDTEIAETTIPLIKIGMQFAEVFKPGKLKEFVNGIREVSFIKDFERVPGWGLKVLGLDSAGKVVVKTRDQLIQDREFSNENFKRDDILVLKAEYDKEMQRPENFSDIIVFDSLNKPASIKDNLAKFESMTAPEKKTFLDSIEGKKIIFKEKIAQHAYDQMLKSYNDSTPETKSKFEQAVRLIQEQSQEGVRLGVLRDVRTNRSQIYERLTDISQGKKSDIDKLKGEIGNQTKSINDYFYNPDGTPRDLNDKNFNLLNPVEAFAKDYQSIERKVIEKSKAELYLSLRDQQGNPLLVEVNTFKSNKALQDAVIANITKESSIMKIDGKNYYVAKGLEQAMKTVSKDGIVNWDSNLFFNQTQKALSIVVKSVYSGFAGAAKNVAQETGAFGYETIANKTFSAVDKIVNKAQGKVYGKDGKLPEDINILIRKVLGEGDIKDIVSYSNSNKLNTENESKTAQIVYEMSDTLLNYIQAVHDVMPTSVSKVSAVSHSLKFNYIEGKIKSIARKNGTNVSDVSMAQIAEIVSAMAQLRITANYNNQPKNLQRLNGILKNFVTPATIFLTTAGISKSAYFLPIGFSSVAVAKSAVTLISVLNNKKLTPIQRQVVGREAAVELIRSVVVVAAMRYLGQALEGDTKKAIKGTVREFAQQIKTPFGLFSTGIDLDQLTGIDSLGDSTLNTLEILPTEGVGSLLYQVGAATQLFQDLYKATPGLGTTDTALSGEKIAKGTIGFLGNLVIPKAVDQVISVVASTVNPKVMKGNGTNIIADIKPELAKVITAIFESAGQGGSNPFKDALVQKEQKNFEANSNGKFKEVKSGVEKTLVQTVAEKLFGARTVDDEAVQSNIDATNQQLSNQKATIERDLASGKIDQNQYNTKLKDLTAKANEAGTTVDKIEAKFAPGKQLSSGGSSGSSSKSKGLNTAAIKQNTKLQLAIDKSIASANKSKLVKTKAKVKITKAKNTKLTGAKSSKTSSIKSSFKSVKTSSSSIKATKLSMPKINSYKFKSSSVKSTGTKLSAIKLPKPVKTTPFRLKTGIKFNANPIKLKLKKSAS